MDREIALSLREVARNERLNPERLATLIKLVSGGRAFEPGEQLPFLHNIRMFGFSRLIDRGSLDRLYLGWFYNLDPTTRERIAGLGEWGLGAISGREAPLYGFKSSTEFVTAMRSLEFQLVLIQRRIIMLWLNSAINSGDLTISRRWHLMPFRVDGKKYRTWQRLNTTYLKNNTPTYFHQQVLLIKSIVTSSLICDKQSLLVDTGRYCDFLFATTRAVELDNGQVRASFKRSKSVNYGSIQIRVPEAHIMGHIERPRRYSIFGMEIYRGTEDKERHFVRSGSLCFDEALFIDKINEHGHDRALIFVHGFNNTFDDACYRFAQILYDGQFDGGSSIHSGCLSCLFRLPRWPAVAAAGQSVVGGPQATAGFIDRQRGSNRPLDPG